MSVHSVVDPVIAETAPPDLIELGDPTIAAERVLIHRVRNGEPEFFYDLIRTHERSALLAAVSILGNHADAEEVAQEAKLKAFKKLSTFRHESKFGTWLIQIVVNEARMRLRKDRRHLHQSLDIGQRTSDGNYVPFDVADRRQIPSDTVEQWELRKELEWAVQSLDEKYRRVLILRDVEHLSIAETARILGISEPNVKSRTSRARLRLRDCVERARSRKISARLGRAAHKMHSCKVHFP